ncbi:LysR substrate-binding domain-containing protein [Pantoea stewartii]|uniref:LysR substrate-binding domain-containing protein n=1 Tax=Pantoea stewartii TaxID=66269 RepID=UPI0021D4A7A3|nr:LysR substrate-binding domain-containing protein [Pantoea stewartii]MCU7365372.1 LysR substrate-binding domain-containing protein [Pantoea stewartii]
MINSDDLRFFQVISASATLAAAARYLDITPPSVTQRLQHIEQKMGIKLILRPAKRIILTDEGEALLARARLILHELDQLQDVIDQTRNRISGTLRVLAPLGFGSEYIAPLLSDYVDQHPDLSVDLMLSDNPNWMQADKWDVAIYIGNLRDSSLYSTRIAPNRRVLCASPDYLQRHGVPTHPAELTHHHCLVIRENAEDVTRWVFAHQHDPVTVKITPRLASNDGRVIKRWALQGKGIMVRSIWDISSEIKQGRLVPLLPEFMLPPADIAALTSMPEIKRLPRTQGFITLLKTTFSAPPWMQNEQ